MAISESKYNMWRTIVALSHADGVFHKKEQEYLLSILDNVDLSDEQKSVLIEDSKVPKDPVAFFDNITEPSDRSQLFYIGRILLWVDDEFTKDEEEAFNKLRELALNKVDFQAVMKRVDQVAEDFKAKEEARKESRPLYQKIIDAIVFWEDLP